MSKSKQKTGEFRIEKKEFEYPPKVTLTEHSYQRYQAGDLPGGRRATLPELYTKQVGNLYHKLKNIKDSVACRASDPTH